MKKILMSVALAFVLLPLWAGGPGEGRAVSVVSEGSKALALSSGEVWVTGDSTLHKYHSATKEVGIEGNISFEKAMGKSLAEAVDSKAAVNFTMKLPVKTLKSGKNGLDKNLYKNLKESDHPEIIFEMKGFVTEGKASAKGATLTAKGTLEIAGESREIELVTWAKAEEGMLRIVGEKPMKMTDFAIKPPKLMLGTVKCSDEISVGFDLLIELATPAGDAFAPKGADQIATEDKP